MGSIGSLSDLTAALRRQAWLIFLMLAVGLPAAYAFAKGRPRLYEAVAIIQIEAPQVAETLTGATATNPAAGAPLDLIEQTLMSRDVVLAFAERFDLFPEAKTPVEKASRTRQAITITRLVDSAQSWRPDVQPTGLSIAVRLGDPEMAAALANALLDRIVEEASVRAQARASRTLEFLMSEEARVDAVIAGVEARVADFRSINIAALPEGLTAQRERLARLQDSRLALDLEVIEAQNGSDRIRPEDAERQLALLDQERVPLLAAIAEAEAALAAAPGVERDLGALMRRLVGLEAELTVITTRRTEAAMNETLETQAQAGRFVPLETAEVPTFPVSADRRKIALAGAAVVAALALVLTLGREVLHPAIHTSAHLERLLGLRPLVVIPRLRSPQALIRRRMALLALVVMIAGGLAAVSRAGLQATLDLLPRTLFVEWG